MITATIHIIDGYGADLTRADVDAFWGQGVCMDDWDVIILAENPDALLVPATDGPHAYDICSEALGNLLRGCCDNEWYRAKYRGTEYAVGVSYHS